MRKRVFVTAGDSSVFFGPGRKEFDPKAKMDTFEKYLLETTKGTFLQLKREEMDEGVIGSFMAAKFINQANLPGFLPFLVPSLLGKPCFGVEGACGTGGRAIGVAVRSILADLADKVFVVGFEMQNGMKSVYGADVLAGAAYYSKMRKGGEAHFFPGLFSHRAEAYFKKYGKEEARRAMAHWYSQAIINARLNPKAQEFHNKAEDLLSLGMTKEDPENFLACLNPYDCSKISDGAASLVVLSEEGMKQLKVDPKECIEIVSFGEAEGDITKVSDDLSELAITKIAGELAFKNAHLTPSDIKLLEIHDCFSITALLSLEALGFAKKGKAPEWILSNGSTKEGSLPTNLSGGLIGFGHPTAASGVRQMVDLYKQMTSQAANQLKGPIPYGMMVSMGGDDKTVSAFIVKQL